MTWDEAKAVASEVLRDLRRRFDDRDLRLILRAIGRGFHHTKENTTMEPEFRKVFPKSFPE